MKISKALSAICTSLVVLTGSLLLMCVSCDRNPVVDTGPTPDDPVTDIDGNVYQTIKIGKQVWTVENLRVTRYNDGTPIPFVTDSAAWFNLIKPGCCYYGNDSVANAVKYGVLYNWYTLNPENPRNIAPKGWHVPTDAEWTILEKYLVLNGYNWDGTTDTAIDNKIAKSLASKTDWKTYTVQGTIGCDLTTNNGSGFSALPGGDRLGYGHFYGQSDYGVWWSATGRDTSYAWDRSLINDSGNLGRGGGSKSCGFSVRLVRDSN